MVSTNCFGRRRLLDCRLDARNRQTRIGSLGWTNGLTTSEFMQPRPRLLMKKLELPLPLPVVNVERSVRKSCLDDSKLTRSYV